jgi:hypothetical protein
MHLSQLHQSQHQLHQSQQLHQDKLCCFQVQAGVLAGNTDVLRFVLKFVAIVAINCCAGLAVDYVHVDCYKKRIKKEKG